MCDSQQTKAAEHFFTKEYKNGYLLQSLHGTEGNDGVFVQWNTLPYPPKQKPAVVSPLYNSLPKFSFFRIFETN